jgi:hypothetical protein
MTRQVERERSTPRIVVAQRGQRRLPHRAIERETVEQHERWPSIRLAHIVGREAREIPDGARGVASSDWLIAFTHDAATSEQGRP